MKKLTLILLISIGIFPLLKSQTVDSIKVEQAGELIKVHYKILNSNASQVFRVTVYCSINGGLQSVIKSLSGDFGDNVIGGRSDYMVLWDVLKDVDEVKSVDFSVRAELVKDYSVSDNTNAKKVSKKRLHVFLVVGGPGPKFGTKIGYMESWGIAGMYAAGGKMGDYDPFDTGPAPSNFVASVNATKRIVNGKNFKIHLLAGPIVSEFLLKDDNGNAYGSRVGIEGGLISSIYNFTFSIGIGQFKDEIGGTSISGDETVGNLGFGWRF